MRWNDEDRWVWSTAQTHDAVIDPSEYEAAQRIRAAGAQRPTEAKKRTTIRRYTLSGMVACGLCGRRMQGQPNHGNTYYRCRFPSEYALTAQVDHPRTVYVQEAPIVAAVDRWLARLFDPEHVDDTCRLLAGAGQTDDAAAAKTESAHRQLADCHARLAKYRTALEAGTDATVVANWIREVEAQRLAAGRTLAAAAHQAAAVTAEDVKAVAPNVRRVIAKLAKADSALKAELYRSLGVHATYLPKTNEIELVVQPVACATERVGGGTRSRGPRSNTCVPYGAADLPLGG